MKTIIKGNISVKKLLGKQKIHNVEYRLMKYSLCTKCSDGTLLHNTITGHLVLLNAEESSIINNSLPTMYSESIVDLIEDYFLVPISYNEKATVDSLRLIMRKLFTPKGVNGYTIMTTTNCNARCFYCYQSNYSHINMTKETADRLLVYMLEHKGQDALHIQWFGGEPLMGLSIIDHISNLLVQKGVDFSSSMISNGYLFTEDIIERAVKIWKLRNIQITLDGTEQIYNCTKSYVFAEDNPYRRVIRNINLLLDKEVFVGIRLNLDQHNADNLMMLIEDLNRLIPNKKQLNIYTHVIYENEGYAPILRNKKESIILYNKQLQINKKLIEDGLTRQLNSLPTIKYRSCMADNPRSMLVYPDGRLYKCEHVIEGDEFGHINSSLIDESKISKFDIPSKMEMCKDCVIYPSCLILNECDGIKDRNTATCQFEVQSKTMALEYQYYRHLSPDDKSYLEGVFIEEESHINSINC